MCIVSFVLDSDKFILTFNRDENSNRPAEQPEWRNFGESEVFCPIDKNAGGTWIGYNKKIAACLQNGAIVKHERLPSYRKSRGLILREILETDTHEKLLKAENFKDIEPFTLSIFEINHNSLSIYRFDGVSLKKELTNLSSPVIISSCTLYNESAQKTIESDFKSVLKDSNSLFKFHDEHRIGKKKNRFTQLVSTVSITQMVIESNRIVCRYLDTLSDTILNIA